MVQFRLIKTVFLFLLFICVFFDWTAQASTEVNEIRSPERSYGVVQVGSVLNVRSGPGKQYSVKGTLKNYTRVELEGKTNNGWYKIKSSQVSGDAYVMAKYIVPVEKPKQDYGYVDTSVLNVRKGPDYSYNIVGTLQLGERINLIGEIDNWYMIKTERFSGPTYVNSSFISYTDPVKLGEAERSYGVVQVGSVLNVRSGPGKQYSVKGTLKNYTRVELEGKTNNGWYKIKSSQVSGDAYVMAKYIVPVEKPKQDYGYVDTSVLNVRKGPGYSYNIVGTLQLGERINLIGEIDNWYMIKTERFSGPTYVNSSFISYTDPVKLGEAERSYGVVQVGSVLNVRSGPGKQYSVKGTLKNYTRVELEGKTNNGWYKIKSSQVSGDAYVMAKYIVPVEKPKQDYGYVDTSVLNVRKGPGYSYNIVGTLKMGELIELIGEVDGWYLVKLKGVKSPTYVKGEFVATSSIKYTTYDITFKQFVDQQMRANPQTDLYPSVGYVSKDYIKNGKVSLKDANSSLNVRSEPRIGNNIIGSLRHGQSVTITGSSGNWYQIRYGSTWKSAKRADVEKYANPNNHDRFQHLVLSKSVGVSAVQLNKVLKGKGILEGRGSAFIEAGRKHGINEIYLISHALLETGNGNSTLAKGVVVDIVDGKKVTPKKVYNMFGIGAYDGCAVRCGAEYAYKQEWTSPEKAITGGAAWIGRGYINTGQDTLYKMRWNPANPGTHQYATDIAWAVKQVSRIKSLYNQLSHPLLYFDIPRFK